MNILIIEDTLEIINKLKSSIINVYPDAKLTICTSYEEAIATISQTAFNLITLDYGLPDGNGYDLALEMRTIETNAKTPIIVITGNEDKAIAFDSYDKIRCIKYLQKPFKMNEFEDVIKNLDLLKQINESRQYYIFENSKLKIKIPTEDILAFEVSNRTCTMVTKNDVIKLGRVSLNALKNDPMLSTFIQVHKSFIVNIDKILNVSKVMAIWEIELGVHRIPIGKKYLSDVQEIWRKS